MVAYTLNPDPGRFIFRGFEPDIGLVPLFPTLAGLAYPVIRSPEWSTDVQRSISGKRTTLGRFIYPIYHFTLNFDSGQGGFLRNTAAKPEYQTLAAFYNTVGGRRDLFRYKDPDDNVATAQFFGTGDGVTRDFQLKRKITGTGFSWSDPVFSASNIQIFKNGVLQTLTTNYTVSPTALVSFVITPAIGDVLTWTGNFQWLVRFDEDMEDFEQFMFFLVQLNQIKFSTEKI